jgi:ABC-type Fe3+ transport system permease subunit
MALMLTGPNNMVLSVAVWSVWAGGDLTAASAVAVVLVAVMTCLVFLVLAVTGGARAVPWSRTSA